MTAISSDKPLRIGSRGSDLALWQSRHIASLVGVPTEIIVIRTQGDDIQHVSLDKVEGKGFFTKEIEEALLAERIDVAVHSFKDLPIETPPGLRIAAVPTRAPRADLLIMRQDVRVAGQKLGLKAGARVGSSSLRRKAHLRSLRPDLELVDLRGNVPTRWNKARDGVLDAVLLAEAGVTRLGMVQKAAADGLVVEPLPLRDVCPAPAQGALAVQIRSADTRADTIISRLHHAPTAREVEVERQLLAHFGGGCHLPLGATCESRGAELNLYALVCSPDGAVRLTAESSGTDAARVVAEVHRQLMSAGADRYL